MFYTRGTIEDFDRTKGTTSVSLPGFDWPIFYHKVLQTTKELPDIFPFNLDANSGKPLGLGIFFGYQAGCNLRLATECEAFQQHRIWLLNLYDKHVLLHAQVAQLVDPRNVAGKLSFGGVRFLQGIGDPNILNPPGILTILDLPSVGQGIQDQPFFPAVWSVNFTQTFDSVTENATRFDEAFAEWNNSHRAPSLRGHSHVAWLRLAPDSPIFENFSDPSAGPETLHIEIAFLVSWQRTGAPSNNNSGNFVSAGLAMVTPISPRLALFNGSHVSPPLQGGSITINSSNPFDPPVIDLGMLQSDFDLFALREALKRAQNSPKHQLGKTSLLAQPKIWKILRRMLWTHLSETRSHRSCRQCGDVGAGCKTRGSGSGSPR
ncbi:hypothetical protein DFH08DRAFT_1037024 [Mycena albidolilacea]|uniref:Glucose-methanol-choline oxidoreductase C-terminal domain-containing protein n=1 Tax=Mycena albidolilacea TaxID=1033008 RepID=A0AAD7EFW5_9AGAR|nr:hypothetical protein DFH08DRAFT_1037024 [Mycena albidolilacea]